ncbi:hypothetical protein Q5752_006501 [Cryptotrichosporon argae]
MSSANKGLSVSLPKTLESMKSVDPDVRLMALIDLSKDLTRLTATSPATNAQTRRPGVDSYSDDYTETALTDMVLKLVNDTNAEVKNTTVTCLALMARKTKTERLTKIVDELLAGVSDKEEEKRGICTLALKQVISEMPVDMYSAGALVNKVVTNILGTVGQPDVNAQHASELLQILADIYTRFPFLIAHNSHLASSSLDSLIHVLSSARPSVRKRAIPALVALVAATPTSFDKLREAIVSGLQVGGETSRVWTTAVAGLAKGSAVAKVGGLIVEHDLIGLALKQTEDLDDSDAVEASLVALEILVLRCPTEMSPYIGALTSKALELVRYDPNYVELDDDDDVDMDDDNDDDEDDDDDFAEDGYSDDEDVSWKIRRAAAKLIASLIGTRIDLLVDFYKTIALTLISRISEREESVRLEVLNALETLLRQTATARNADLYAGGRNKRKRSEGMDEDAPEDSAISQLSAIRAQLVKALLKQVATKSLTTRPQVFNLLRQITEALGGGLDSEADAVSTAALATLKSSDSTTPALTIAVLSFLAAFFMQHPAKAYASHLNDLTDAVVGSAHDKLQRVNFEAFAAASAIAQSIRPIERGALTPMNPSLEPPVQTILSITIEVLSNTSVDATVREKALVTLGDLLVHEGDVLTTSYESALPIISTRLASENTAATAVQVIGRIAESDTCTGTEFNKWLLDIVPEVLNALRRTKRAGKVAEFTCLQDILARLGTTLPADEVQGIVRDLASLVDYPPALSILGLILANQPASRSTIDDTILPQVLELLSGLSINLASIEPIAAFFSAYVEGDIDSATRLVPLLVSNVGKLAKQGAIPDATSGGTSAYTATASCIGAIVGKSQRNLAGVVAAFQKTIRSAKATDSDVYLALLSIGEIGRTTDLSSVSGLFEKVLELFGHKSEEVRSAVAFAAGNMAVASSDRILPVLVQELSNAKDGPTRVLLLHALKEVILHTSGSKLEVLADKLWAPLFADQEALGDDLGDDGIRNVKAACIGKLTTAAPGKFLPQLQALLKSKPRDKAIVAASVRYAFIDPSSANDDVLAPLIGDFLSLLKDDNVIVRRLSLASLSAAIQNKPHLVIDRLASLQPLLYAETEIKPELQRQVQMGPFKVTEDDGLENRKAAYETMYILLGTALGKLDIATFTDRVVAAINEKVNEIRVIGLMLLLRLAQLAPSTVTVRLDDLTPAFKEIVKDIEVKDDTVRHDLERKEEMQRSALRTAVPLYKMSTATQAPAFHAFVAGLLQADKWKEYRDYEA